MGTALELTQEGYDGKPWYDEIYVTDAYEFVAVAHIVCRRSTRWRFQLGIRTWGERYGGNLPEFLSAYAVNYLSRAQSKMPATSNLIASLATATNCMSPVCLTASIQLAQQLAPHP